MKTEISDCKYNRLVKGEREQTLFLAFNKEQIKLNISQGKGEFVHAWASLFGCPSDINARFSNILKKNYNLVFDANIPIETAISSTKKILSSDRKLEQACSAI
jgi:adenine-specific DNA methylase